MTKYLNGFLFAVLALALFMGSCKEDDTDDNTNDEPTLYERVGGTTMVADPNNSSQMIEQGYLTLRSVVDSAIFVIAADTVMAPYFQVLLTEVGNGDLSGVTALSASLTNFMAVATGAENFSYNGRDMVTAHDPAQYNRMGLAADDAAYDAFIADVGTALGQNGVTDTALINDLVALLETLRSDIVQR
ncbi:group 1 truncated hemoglobin [Saprospira grandis]|uniref:group 1 truncated hemoglobin n=1 Tax=Saprospira grandis TaxID=1008 RepID=UPI0022DD6CDE|nr:group 1 truncated hemoglobin [Saprospira grandis]WBM75791.1 group 1 truncated hemoglobin [Saprospira grandis]